MRNDGGTFVDVTSQWNLPLGGNTWGVTVGDFNNDSKQDVLVIRYPFIKHRVADYMLLNTGTKFEITTAHQAHARGCRCHGDMGAAFDFDLDGDVDILTGDDEFGNWNLFGNTKSDAFKSYNFV